MDNACAADWLVHPFLRVYQSGYDFRDPEGALARALQLPATDGLLIRPDAILAAFGKADSIKTWLDRWIGG